jgi:ABC-type glycerol-3-phosphate transport system permease component
MKKKKKISKKTIIIFIVLAIIGLIYFIPLEWVTASSLRPSGSLYEYTEPLNMETFIPVNITFENYVNIFTQQHFGRALMNSLIVACSTVLLTLLVSSMAGFALAKFDFPGKKFVFVIVLITFMVPFESIVIPLYLTVSALGFINTYAALILPGVANGLAIFLFNQFFSEIPTEILEAARIDGASWFRIYRKIVIPLSVPAIITVVVMVFMFQWNSLFWPLVATHSTRLEVVQVAISANRMTEATHWANLFSSAVAGSIPPMVLFFFLQKYFVRGISGTGLKS